METEDHATQDYNMELYEEQYFYNMDVSRITNSSANYSNAIQDGCSNCNEGALTNSTQRIGPAIILDVMNGDVLDLEVYAKSAGGSGNSAVGKSTLVNALVNAFVPSGLSSELGTKTQTLFNTNDVYNAMRGGSPVGSNPRAYLSYVIFDQHMEVVTSGHRPVSSTSFHKLSFNNININQKGYIYIWVSNENATNRTVYFDDLVVSHTKGNILQEDHYYPFGMNMHGLSSSASLMKPNMYKYNAGTELTADFNWQMYDTPYRSYDAQLGRFHQIDPLADIQEDFTPYHFGYNDPVYWNDPTGLTPSFSDIVNTLMGYEDGGSWDPINGFQPFTPDEAFWAGFDYNETYDLWHKLEDGLGVSEALSTYFGESQIYLGTVEVVSNEPRWPSWWGDWRKLRDRLGLEPWDSNADGILQKSEADDWWLNGNGVSIQVDNSNINWTGLKIPANKKVGDIFAISTTGAFLRLPFETAATYGGTSFVVINSKTVRVMDQKYHYDLRPNNSFENRIRNWLTKRGKPDGSGTDYMIRYRNPFIRIK